MTTLKLNVHFSGRALTVAPGDRLELQLEENPTTGFRWYVADDNSGVLILEHDAFGRPPSGVSGAGGTREFVFIVAKRGQVTLRAYNRRSWEQQQPPHATFAVTITAR